MWSAWASAFRREVSSGNWPTSWVVPGSATNPGPAFATTGWASALLVAPPHRFNRTSSRLTWASGGGWAFVSPIGGAPESGDTTAWAPADGFTAWGCARGSVPAAVLEVPGALVPAVRAAEPQPARTSATSATAPALIRPPRVSGSPIRAVVRPLPEKPDTRLPHQRDCQETRPRAE